jgi:hypothetical protein
MSTLPSDSSGNNGQGTTNSSNAIIVEATGPEDTTIRPLRPNIPRYWPGREPPPELQGLDSEGQTPSTPPPSDNS